MDTRTGYSDVELINSFYLKWELDLAPPTMASELCMLLPLAPYSCPLSYALLASASLVHTEKPVPPGPLHQL